QSLIGGLQVFRKLHTSLKASLLLLGVALPASYGAADDYPSKPIQLNVPFGASSSTNVAAQALIPYYQEELGGTIVPNYTSGGGGTIGVGWMVSQPADGYALGLIPTGPVLP